VHFLGIEYLNFVSVTEPFSSTRNMFSHMLMLLKKHHTVVVKYRYCGNVKWTCGVEIQGCWQIQLNSVKLCVLEVCFSWDVKMISFLLCWDIYFLGQSIRNGRTALCE